jgi:hypothetical protein
MRDVEEDRCEAILALNKSRQSKGEWASRHEI